MHRSPLQRVLLASAVTAALVVGTTAGLARADSPAKPVSPVIMINKAAATTPIETTPLRGPLSMLSGSGGNITVLSGKQGKLMVDAGIAVSRPRIEAALTAISNAPIKYLINTHYHWDHTDGNPWVHDDGATIIATAGTAARVSKSIRVDDWDFTFPPLPASGVPTEILKANKTYHFDGQTVEVVLVDPAHTDTDLYVVFKEANVAALGDLFWNGVYPFIDNENGGGIDGMIKADDAILAQLKDDVILAPGHGPVGTKKQFREFRDMLAGVRDKVAALKKQGKSRDEVVAAKPTAQYDAVYGHFVIDPDFFTRIVYDGLK
ncbi:MBL fold metallo-hydrolase [Luteibacter rhizovicinus DSM 16549]|uniref:MBL fold metallo-hydrolase n=1 Tax=Luteibacter rhizovicinus DSM 16549 TaxID=1440763 RepID=A0A0G9HCI5_9GAMM|nr:MBL fold metallo-hydrolase [Luteibacter rhizovicinus]APG05676.1 MBL fold metallo-hydrolase [Luteibacter rhizovicinus DSM 16549]KLD66944.1 cyclase [Luteibacter rhizovicinus DSM 16549]KLD73149.1 cyclase [Xanthomonas hyacinthi DSM 19077]